MCEVPGGEECLRSWIMILSNVFFSGMLFGSITGNYDDDGSTTYVSESFFVICRVG